MTLIRQLGCVRLSESSMDVRNKVHVYFLTLFYIKILLLFFSYNRLSLSQTQRNQDF